MIHIDLSGRSAVVTGATGQLGRVMAHTLADAGADIAVHYLRNEQKAAQLVSEISGKGRKALAVQADVSDRASVEKMRDAVRDTIGSPGIVVNSAVVQYDWTTVLEQAVSDYESQFRSCVLHNVLMAQAFVPGMIDRGWGRIVGINTECAMQTAPGQSAYVSGKRGMDGVLRVLAREVGEHGITVNQVAPGWTISEDKPDSDSAQAYRDKVPMKRRGTDQEIANVVAFLASDLASFVTGAYIPVCGGDVMPAI
jgi:3-oxoacyl-[acyl-carrier protein] reductase